MSDVTVNNHLSIIAFLTARLGEDERAAKAAVEIGEKRYGEMYHDEVGFDPGGIGIDDGWLTLDAERMLREVEAKRNIVTRLSAVLTAFTDPQAAMWPDVSRRERTHAYSGLCDLAAVYCDHQDFDPEWRR